MANTLYAGSRDEKFVGWTNIDCKVDISHFQKMEEDYNFITKILTQSLVYPPMMHESEK